MRFKRSTDPFPEDGGRWHTYQFEDHRIVHLVLSDYGRQELSGSGIYVWDGNMMVKISEQPTDIFFRPHVFYGNNQHERYAAGISYQPIGLRFMNESDDEVETFFIDPKHWKVAGVWEDTEFDGNDWYSHANKQDMKKIFDDWELPKNIVRVPGKPNKWVWNESSPNRWKGIMIDGTDHAIWLGDDRSVKQMLSILDMGSPNYDAINNKVILS